MKKVLMVASVASMIGQFNMNNISILQEQGYEVYVACNFKDRTVWTDERVKQFIKELKVEGIWYYHIDFPRNPTDVERDAIAYKQLKKLVAVKKINLIHCHTPVGGVLGRIVGHELGVKVIYTAHGFHFYDGAPKKNWVIFYPIEKFFSKWTDVLITINKEDYKRAKKKFHARKTVYVPGVGIDTKKFNLGMSENKDDLKHIVKRQMICKEFNIPIDAKLLLSVGELNENKNHESVIKALADITGVKDKKVYYLIAGQGCLKDTLQTLINKLGLSNYVYLMGFRNDVADIYGAADIYILPSLREGLNVSLMEAMASGLPCICSLVRGSVDLIDRNGGGLFDPGSIKDISNTIEHLIASSTEQLEAMGNYNLQKIKSFDKAIVEKSITAIYSEMSEQIGGRAVS